MLFLHTERVIKRQEEKQRRLVENDSDKEENLVEWALSVYGHIWFFM